MINNDLVTNLQKKKKDIVVLRYNGVKYFEIIKYSIYRPYI